MTTPIETVLEAAFERCTDHTCYEQTKILAAIRALGGTIKHEGEDTTMTIMGTVVSVCGLDLANKDNGFSFEVDGKVERHGPLKFVSVRRGGGAS